MEKTGAVSIDGAEPDQNSEEWLEMERKRKAHRQGPGGRKGKRRRLREIERKNLGVSLRLVRFGDVRDRSRVPQRAKT